MKKFRILATAETKVKYIVEAENEDDAIKLWEDMDPSLGYVLEEETENEVFHSIEEVGVKK